MTSSSRSLVLLIEDNDQHVKLIRRYLEGESWLTIEHVGRLSAALDRLEAGGVDLILLDLSLPDSKIDQTFTRLSAAYPDVPIVVLTSLPDQKLAASAARRGAQDYIVKSELDARSLPRIIRYSIERRQILRQLEQQNEELKQFALVLGHEVRHPLHGLSLSLSILRELERRDADPLARRHLTSAEASVRKLSRLVDDLLSFARVEAHTTERQAVALDQVAEEVERVLRPMLADSGAEIERGSLPVVEADPMHVEQVVMNLVSNAIKFRRENEAPRIVIDAHEDGEFWCLTVRDNGLGIDTAEHDRIFDIFVRTGPGADMPGDGIGLAVCRRIVEHYNGRIWLESEVDKGTTFFLQWPRSQTAGVPALV